MKAPRHYKPRGFFYAQFPSIETVNNRQGEKYPNAQMQINDRPADDHHAQVVRTLRQQPQYQSIANRLNNLRKRRNTAETS